MAIQIQLRRGTASQWTTANTVLAQGEVGFETDTGKIKIGDGTTAWSTLAYWVGGGASFQPLDADLTAIAALSTTGILKRTGSDTWALITDNSTNWDSAYTDRLKWDGGATGLTASTGRTSLGATTVGSNLFTLTNPSAITFPKINADNSVSTESASTHRTSIGATTVGGNIFTLTNPSAITFIKVNADNTVATENAATYRTSIGATTVGSNLFTLTNPSAISFVKINADNTITAESAATFKTSLSLNNVENTALSTWAGSTNLTTLGTISTLTLSTADTATAASHYFVETASDGVVRPKTLANVKSEILATPTLTGTVTASGFTTAGLVTNTSGGVLGTATYQRVNADLLGFTTVATANGSTTLTNASTSYQVFTGTSNQTVVLPVTSTLSQSWTFHIVNNSTGTLTVNSSGGNLVITIPAGVTAMITCTVPGSGTAGTTAADWEAGLTDFSTYTGTGNVVLSASPTFTGTVGAANITATGTIVGVEEVLPFAKTGTIASSTTGTLRFRFPFSATILGISAILGTAGTGNTTVNVVKNGTTNVNASVVTLTSGVAAEVTSFTSGADAMTTGDYITVNIVTAGTSAADLSVLVRYKRA